MLANGPTHGVSRGGHGPKWESDCSETLPGGAVVGSALGAAAVLAGDTQGAVRGSSTSSELMTALSFLAQLPLALLNIFRRAISQPTP